MRRGSTRLSRNVKNELSNETRSCGDHCVSLDTDRRRRRKGAEEDDSVRLQGKRFFVGLGKRKSSRSIRVELQQELACRSERRVTKTPDTKAWDTVCLVMAFICANKKSRRHAEVNAESLSEYEHDQKAQ